MAYGYYPQYFAPPAQAPIPQMVQQPPIQQPIQPPPMQPQPMQAQPQQIQNNGFLLVPSEEVVNSYPVAAGNCVTFKIEGKPIVMEKSMGFSQLESPRIERYRLVKEPPAQPQEAAPTVEPDKITVEDIESRFKAVWDAIEDMKKELVKPASVPKKKKEGAEDVAE